MAQLQGTSECDRSNHTSVPAPRHGLQLDLPVDPFQPGTDFTLIEPARVAHRPIPPVISSHPHQRFGHAFAQRSDGGVTFDEPQMQARKIDWTPPGTHALSTTGANVGRRRLQHGPMLLLSPARPGHSSRMMQIFEEAKMANSASPRKHGVTLYPQLPNISRASRPKHREQSCENMVPNVAGISHGLKVPLSGALSALPETEPDYESPATLSEHPSGSWTDDSGYIKLESRNQRSTESPQRLVLRWLTTVSQSDDQDARQAREDGLEESNTTEEYTQEDISVPIAPWTGQERKPRKANHVPRPSLSRARLPINSKCSSTDPFIASEARGISSVDEVSVAAEGFHEPPVSARICRDISDTCKRIYHDQSVSPTVCNFVSSTPRGFENVSTPASIAEDPNDGGIQFSPLSPNVCIDRPSRYHSPLRSFPKLVSPDSSIPLWSHQSTKVNLATEAETLYRSSLWQTMSRANILGSTSFSTSSRKQDDDSEESTSREQEISQSARSVRTSANVSSERLWRPPGGRASNKRRP